MKYIKLINSHTKKQDLQYTDSLLAISENQECDVWLKMSEFARAWAYACDAQIRVIPGLIISPASLRNIKEAKNTFGNFRTLTMWQGLPKGGEFCRIAYINTKEKAELLRLYTIADANPETYFKILFFWHTIVYPSKNDIDAVNYINKNMSVIHLTDHQRNILSNRAFGVIEDDNIGNYIYKHIRHAIAHIKRNSGISLILEDKQQNMHLTVISNILKSIAKYKLDHDYDLTQNAPKSVCHLYDPDNEFNKYSLCPPLK